MGLTSVMRLMIEKMRENLSAYDAMYVALAETLDTVVLTCDAPLSRAPGLGRRIELVLADA